MKSLSHYVNRFRQARFLTLSFLIHVCLVAFLGGVVLFKAVQPVETFSANTSGFIEPAEEENVEEVSDSGSGDFEEEAPAAVEPTNAQSPASAITTTLASNISLSSASVPVQSSGSMLRGDLPTMTSRTTSAGGVSSKKMGSLAGRMAASRGELLKQNGGTQEAEQAVLLGLRWLQKNQNPNGSWGTDYRGGMSGLALLAFLGHGETPRESLEFGGTVSKAIDIILKEGADNNGSLVMKGRNCFEPYQHGIGAYSLAEALAMTQDERIRSVLLQAIDHIIKGQRADGGWTYNYSLSPDEQGKPQSDTSVSGWQIQALKTALLAELPHEGIHPALEKAMKNLERVFDERTGTFGYRQIGDKGKEAGAGGMTGVGVLCTFFIEGKSNKLTRDGLDFILNLPRLNFQTEEGEPSFYSWYYMTQACFQAQGSSWTRWNRMFQDQLIQNQNPDGSWPVMGAPKNHDLKTPALDAAVYRTALAILMLEVYYRYSPVSKLAPQG